MMRKERRGNSLHTFAMLAACSTFLLVIAGGLVTSTGSGLSVPDWPLSYGKLMPPMVGGILYEHGHRMVATFVGILTVILAIWAGRSEERRWVRVLAYAALAAVVVQGVLGGLTVLFLLPTAISVSHATLAQSFFSLMVVLALVTSNGWKDVKPELLAASATTRKLALGAGITIFVQLILGAWMRHSNAGLAIPDFPLVYDRLIPPVTRPGLDAANALRSQLDLPAVTLGQIWIHFAHRLGALAVTAAVLSLSTHILRAYPKDPRMREPAIMLLLLLVAQVFLGAATVWTEKAVPVATAHVATGALMLAVSVVLILRTYHLFTAPERMPSFVMAPQTGNI